MILFCNANVVIIITGLLYLDTFIHIFVTFLLWSLKVDRNKRMLVWTYGQPLF